MRAHLGVPAVPPAVVLAAAAPASAASSAGAPSDETPEYPAERDAPGCRGAGRRRSPISPGDATTPGQPRDPSGFRRPSIIGRGSALACSALAAALLAGCAGEVAATASAGTGSPSTTSVEPFPPTTSAPDDPTDDETVGQRSSGQSSSGQSSSGQGSGGQSSGGQSSSGQGSGNDGSSVGNSGDGGSGGESTGGGTEGLPGWPIESTPSQGAQLWAAYLAVGAPGDPELQQVLEEVQQLWPGAGLGELGCDEGAAEALGRNRTEHAVAVYFATQQHITEFRRRWDGPYVGAVQVTTFCAD